MNATAEKLEQEVGVPVIHWDAGLDPRSKDCPYLAARADGELPDIFYSTAPDIRNGGRPGAYVVSRYQLQFEVMQNHEIFSSKDITHFSRMLGEDWPLVPLELDAPEHKKYRSLLNPLFGPVQINKLEADVRKQAVDLIEKVRNKGECEFMEAFGRPFPVGVFMRLMGLPLDEMPTFLKWEEGLLHSADIDVRTDAARNIKNYLLDLIEDRRKNPRDDLATFVVQSKIDGEPISDEKMLGICYLFFVGGLDTVAATLGFTFRELARRPELQNQLREHPELVPDALEECIRAFGTVVSSRFLTRDYEFHGVKMRKGDRVAIPFGLASRDDQEYPDPNTLDFNRENTRNISFAAGPHRCIGSHLARREFKIALEEWTARVPEFRIKAGEKPIAHGTGVWGVDYLPLTW